MAEIETGKTKAKKSSKAVPYKGHRAGSRKGMVHKTFDTKGEKTAFSVARMHGIKESTAKQWISVWKREAKADMGEDATKLAADLANVEDSDAEDTGEV